MKLPVSFMFLIVAATLGGCGVPSAYQGIGVERLKPGDEYLSASELSASCAGLEIAMGLHASDVKKQKLALLEELKKPAQTVERMFKRSSGIEGQGTVAFDQITKERRTMSAINTRLQRKGCTELDIDRAIADASIPNSKACPGVAANRSPIKHKAPVAPADGCT